ncbi:MAG: FGGY family carbohydrate kinase [Candidatus Latescibacterota bacterium]
MTPHLLLDFGTTSTKSALVDLDSGAYSHVQSHPSIPAAPATSGRYEVPLDAIRDRFAGICRAYRVDLGIPLQGITLCSEMHGFAVLDARDQPLTPYLSWKDERCLETVDGVSSFELVCGRLGDEFRTLTGMRPRPGFLLPNLVHVARTQGLPPRARVVSLPGWLALGDTPGQRVEHPTILAALTLYDVNAGTVSARLLGLVEELTGCACAVGAPAADGEVAGWWTAPGERVPIHVGVGDHQASLLGAGLKAGALSLNLGTGSQVSVVDDGSAGPEVEVRPYFDGRRLATVTHVPAGRALNEFLGLLQEAAGGRGDFWQAMAALDPAEVAASDLEVDLSIFPGSRGYHEGGSISRIREGRLTVRHFLASLLRSLAGQYPEVAAQLDPQRRCSRCLLSGGIARRLQVLQSLIAASTGYETLPATPLDESLLGLRTLALVAAGRASTCDQAAALFGRECVVA